MSQKIILFSLVLLLATGCRKTFVISDKQAILFQFDYVNYAWGYQHNGFIIDNEGNVLTYNNPVDWNFPDNDFYISEDDIAENLSKCLLTGKKITETELKKYTNHINNIAASKVTALKNSGADAGSLEYICYQFSEGSGIYKGSLIKMEGDFTCENLNFYSKKVATWLRDIHNTLQEN